MATYCKVEAGIIVDRIVFDGTMPEDFPERDDWVISDTYQIGWISDGDGGYNAPSTDYTVSDDELRDRINAERQRRILAGTVIDGVHVTGRDEDARNLTNLALAAQLRIAGGDTTTLTVYRDGQNIDHELTPPQMLALWQQSAAYVSALYAASWAIKAMEPLPADVTDDGLWPARG